MTYFLDAVTDHIARYENLPTLAEPDCSCNRLVLNARVPLQLNDEDAVGACQIKAVTVSRRIEMVDARVFLPECAGPGSHDQDRLALVARKLVQDALPLC